MLTAKRQESSALKATTSLLESEVTSLEDDLQWKKEEREVERVAEKKRMKDLEREKQLEKDAKVTSLESVGRRNGATARRVRGQDRPKHKIAKLTRRA